MTTRFSVGDLVEIHPEPAPLDEHVDDPDEYEEYARRVLSFSGLRARVINDLDESLIMVHLQPVTDRPDTHGTEPFFWSRDQLELVASAG